MGATYHQFCPVAKSMELLDERWTLLVVRELVTGSEHFNELRRGLPRMSPSLLSRRLQQLTRAGIVERRVDGNEVRYVLTDAGRELQAVVDALGTWGVRWIGHLGEEDLDPKLLLWDMHRHVDPGAVPKGRTVLRFRFPDVPPQLRDWCGWSSPAARPTSVTTTPGTTSRSPSRGACAAWSRSGGVTVPGRRHSAQERSSSTDPNG
jgi:DNA-binding HxlR family transcriptional regulator